MRKLALSGWSSTFDASIYTVLECKADRLKEYINSESDGAEVSITTTHVVTVALAKVFERYPVLNRVIIRKKFRQRHRIDAFIIVNLRKKKSVDLSGVCIEAANTLTCRDMAVQISNKVHVLREGKDRSIARVQGVLERLNSRVAYFLLKSINVILGSLNISLTGFGLPRHRFGSFMVSNLGSLGVDEAYIPLFPPARCPLIVGVPKIKPIAVVQGRDVVAEQQLRLCLTIDHRYIDGFEGAKALRYLKKILENPFKYL